MKNRMKGHLLRTILLSVIVFGLSLPLPAAAEQEGTFSGTWTASGKWQPVDFSKGREVFTYRLAGHVNLVTGIGEVKDFWSECVGLWDSETGGPTRCVWKETSGKDKAYVILDGQVIKKGVRVNGEFVDGTGDLKGLAGKISFTWSTVFRNRTDRVLTGHTKDLQGSYHIQKSAK